jgi:hypothetical protein
MPWVEPAYEAESKVRKIDRSAIKIAIMLSIATMMGMVIGGYYVDNKTPTTIECSE